MRATDAFTATTRFGLGARKGDFAAISADPRGWLDGQLSDRYAVSPALAGFPAALDTVREFRARQQMKREAKQGGAEDPQAAREKFKDAVKELRQDYIRQIAA